MPVVELAVEVAVAMDTVMVATSQSTLMILKKLVVNDHHGNDYQDGHGHYGGGHGENCGFREREFPIFDAHQTWVFSVLYLLALSATLAAAGFR